MIDFRKYLTNAEKGIIVMENALHDERATSKLLRHFRIVVLKSSTQIYREHLQHF